MRAYTDSTRENDKWSLPDVEVFYLDKREAREIDADGAGWFYAYGLPGCLPDSDPFGPFKTSDEAVRDARLNAGSCAHGIPDGQICPECDEVING